MASIKAKLSSVELYVNQCGDDYSMIIHIANDVLSRAEKLYIITQEELEKISRQLNRAQRSYDDIEHKVNSYMQRMEDAADKIERCREEIDYIYHHPSTVTTTDEEGNETTEEVIDYDAIHAAEREMEAARSTYYLYENKCNDARMVLREAGYTVSRFQNTKYGIEAVTLSIQNDIYEIKKYIRAIEDEAEFNVYSLQCVIDSLQSYLASKAIFMPEGSYYKEFSSARISNSTLLNGINVDVSDTSGDEEIMSDTIDKSLSTEDKYDGHHFIDYASIEKNIAHWEATKKSDLIYAINMYLGDLGQTAASKEELEKVNQIIPNLIKNGAILVHQDRASKRFIHIMEDRYKTKTDVFRDSKKEISGGGSYTIEQRIVGSKKILGHVLDENAGSEISCCLVDDVSSIQNLVENYTGNYGSIISVFEMNKVKDSLVYCGGDSMDDLALCNIANSKIETFYKLKAYHGVVGLVDRPTLGAIPCDAAAKLIVAMRMGEHIDSVTKYMKITGKYVECMITKPVRFKEHISQVVLCPEKSPSKEELISLDLTKRIKEQKSVLWANNQGLIERL